MSLAPTAATDERILTLLERQQSEISKLQKQMTQLFLAVRVKNRRRSSSSSSAWTASDAETVRASGPLRPKLRSPTDKRRLIERGTDVQRASLASSHTLLTAVRTDDEQSEPAASSSEESSDDELTRRILRKYLGKSIRSK